MSEPTAVYFCIMEINIGREWNGVNNKEEIGVPTILSSNFLWKFKGGGQLMKTEVTKKEGGLRRKGGGE